MGPFRKKRSALDLLLLIICSHALHSEEVKIVSLADNGIGTLRDAMSNAADGDFLIFDATLSGTISLESDLPNIVASYSIQGPTQGSVSIDGASLYQIFMLDSGNASISNLSLRNPNSVDGGACYLKPDASLHLDNISIARPNSGNMKLIEMDLRSTLFVKDLTVSNFSRSGTIKDLLGSPDSMVTFNIDPSMTTDLVFEGMSTLVKEGKGLFNLFTENTEDLTVTINEGSLIFNGSTSDMIIVGRSGFLGGVCSCSALINDGTIRPGNSIGIIQTIGDYHQSGTLEIEISTTGASDLVEVGGNAFLDGSLLIMPEPGVYLQGDRFTFLTTGGNIQGYFDTISSINPGFDFEIVPSNQSVQLIVLQNSISSQDAQLTGNSLSTLDLFENASTDRNSDLFSVMSALNTLDSSSLEGALNQLNQDSFPAISWSEATTLYQMINAASYPFSYCDYLCEATENSCCPVRKPDRFWTKAIGEKTSQDRVDQLPGFLTYAGGILFGYDKKIKKPLTLGCYGAYIHNNFQWKDPDEKGRVQINGYSGSLYASTCSKYFQADLSVAASFFQQDVSRNIVFGEFYRKAESSPDAHAILGHLGAYGIFPIKQTLLSPFGKVDYISIWQHQFQESGAGSINLSVPSTQLQFLHAEIGLYSNRRFCFSWGAIIPSASLSWVYFGPVSSTDIKGALSGISQTFTVQTSNHCFNAISPMLELSAIISNQFWIAAAYKGEFSSGRIEQDLNLNFRWQF